MKHSTQALDIDLQSILSRVSLAVALQGQPQVGYAALDEAFNEIVGHNLFTILEYHADAAQAKRCYSSQPDAYPVGGCKTVTHNAWTEQVLEHQRAYIGSDYDDIKSVFFDHELIRSLGCESVLNLPVVFNGQTLGTINLLHEAHWYDNVDVHRVSAMSMLATPGLALSWHRNRG